MKLKIPESSAIVWHPYPETKPASNGAYAVSIKDEAIGKSRRRYKIGCKTMVGVYGPHPNDLLGPAIFRCAPAEDSDVEAWAELEEET